MQDSDLQELQKDTFVIVVALVIVLSLILFYVTLIKTYVFNNPNTFWWLPSVLSLGTCIISYKLYRRNHFRPGTYTFVGGLTLAIVSFMVAPNTQFPQLDAYLLAPVVAIAGVLINPPGAMKTAGFATVATLGVALLLNGPTWAGVQPLIVPLVLMYFVAAVCWVSFDQLIAAIRWVLDSHGRAQQRSRALYESQYELEIAYKMLEQANISLLEARTQALQASEFKSRFIANLSHELRTPLSAIINLSFILSKGQHGPVSPEQQDYLARIHDSGNLLLQIVNDLLDLAKIEAGQMELFREPVDMAAISNNALTTISGLMTDKPKLELRQEIEPNLPKIYGDGMRIRQVLLNLLGNAVKFTEEGHVTLRVAQEDGSSIKVSIIDTGIGIKREELDRIFEEYKQTQDTFAVRKIGTGLGLPISRKFVELHGGRLWGESEYGRGSAFHFTLPLTAPPKSVNLKEQDWIEDKVAAL